MRTLCICAGTVNCHTHSSEHWARGLIKPLPLELWLHELVRMQHDASPVTMTFRPSISIMCTQVLHEPRGEEGGKLLGYENPHVDCPAELIGVLRVTRCCVSCSQMVPPYDSDAPLSLSTSLLLPRCVLPARWPRDDPGRRDGDHGPHLRKRYR